MIESLIKFETAKLAHKKRFFNGSSMTYFKDKTWAEKGVGLYINSESNNEVYEVVTQAMLQKLLREIHNIAVTALPFRETNEPKEESVSLCWYYSLVHLNDDLDILCNEADLGCNESDFYDTYEEAIEEGLISALKQIK